MTPISFTYYSEPLPDKIDGNKVITNRSVIHLYVKALDPTWTESPREERKALSDAMLIVSDICRENDKPTEDRLLKIGDPPEHAKPIFQFVLGVNWNREMRMPHYSRVSYARYDWDARYNPVANLGMYQYSYTFKILRNREHADVKAWLSKHHR